MRAEGAAADDAREGRDTSGDRVGDEPAHLPSDRDPTADGLPGPVELAVDRDADGVPDSEDAFPEDATESVDTDGDGVGDNADAFPTNAAEASDSDGDGVGDNADAFPNDGTQHCAVGSWDADSDVGTACVAWTACGAGERITADGTATSDRTCAACAAGTFSTTPNTAACADWSDCAGGQYVTTAGAANANRVCAVCPVGEYSIVTNATSCTAWPTCTDGTDAEDLGSVPPSDVAVDAGTQLCPIARWPLDEGSGEVFSDVSGGGNDATAITGRWRNGYVGSGYSGIAVTSTELPDLTSMTVALWVRLAGAGTGGEYSRILSWPSDAFELATNDVSDLRLYAGEAHPWTVVATGLVPGQWHLVVITRGDGETRTYVDGALRGVVPASSTLSGAMAFGARSNGGGEEYPGDYDDVRIYDRALTANEVDALLPSSCADLLWRQPAAADGDYLIDPDGNAGQSPVWMVCDMTNEDQSAH